MATKPIFIHVSKNENGWWAYVDHRTFYMETKEYNSWKLAVMKLKRMVYGALTAISSQAEVNFRVIEPKETKVESN